MKKLLVAFDVDDTLITITELGCDVPNYEMIDVYRWFQSQGHFMIIWSGGGKDYAHSWGDRLGLNANFYDDKYNCLLVPDLAFDDSDLTLATVNVKVKRINNSAIRYPERVRK